MGPMEYDASQESRSSSSNATRRSRRALRWTWPVVAALLVGAVSGVAVAAAIHMPRVDKKLADYTPSLVTQLYDKNGRVYTTFARERRVMLKEGQIPKVVQDAVLASEDANFFEHGGIDAMGILRAAYTDIRAGRVKEGASTISMQLARSVFLSRERTWRRKIEEAFLAVELEKNYSKQQILALYLNLVNLGHGNYGVEAASRYFFNKPAAKLTLPEAATLAGILPAPSRYSPYRTPEMVTKQRDRVLRRMLEEGFITTQQYQRAVAQPLLVTTQQAEEKSPAPYFSEDVRKFLETTYGATALYEDGLQVQTTLDPQIQRSTEKAIREGLARLDRRRGWRGPVATLEAADLDQQLPTWGQGKPVPGRWYQGLVLEAEGDSARVKIGKETYPLEREGISWTGRRQPSALFKRGDVAWFRFEVPESKAKKPAKPGETPPPEPAAEPRLMLEQPPRMEAAAVVVENRTGAVRAMVGGWDFERNKFNRITQARRQVGSSFKPFVYGAAIEAGWTPSDTLLDAPASFRGGDGRLSYRPQNYYKKHYGIVTLRRALEQSINIPAVKLLDLVGPRRVVDFAHRAGIKTQLPTWPSVALGSTDLIPLEVASAYATIANGGMHVEPYFIEKITAPDGQVLLPQRFPATYSATSPEVAYVLTHMMEGVVDHGTAYEIHDLPIDIAGKTGTTDDYSDAWFVAYTPRYTILTWVGYDQKKSLGSGMSGAVAALPLWRRIAEDGLKTGWLKEGETFPVPPGVMVKDIDYTSGLLAKGGRTIKEAFVTGTEPNREHDAQWSTITSLPWYQQKAFYIPKEGENMPGKAGDEAQEPQQVQEDPGPADTPSQEPPPPGDESADEGPPPPL
jgi:penicillin-binding protein 1A